MLHAMQLFAQLCDGVPVSPASCHADVDDGSVCLLSEQPENDGEEEDDLFDVSIYPGYF